MERDILCVDSNLSAFDCSQKMVAARKGYAIILKDQKPFGMVTEWDFLEKLVSKSVDPTKIRIEEICNSPLLSCAQDLPTDQVIGLMANKGIRRIVVMEKENVVGVITSKIVLRIFREYVDKISSDIARLQSFHFLGL